MPDPDRQLELALRQFRVLQRAFIDASSLIYMRKCAILVSLAATIELHTIPEVLRETGFNHLPVTVYREGGSSLTTDDLLVEAAEGCRLPVISEDKKVLTRTRERGLACFNTVMMLHFLYYKKVLPKADHNSALAKLQQIARYGPLVWAFSRRVYARIETASG